MPTTVQVSARILHWPDMCACCGGPADTSFAAGFSKSKGKRVVRTESKWWKVPYCRDCIKHVRGQRAAVAGCYWSVGAAIAAIIGAAAGGGGPGRPTPFVIAALVVAAAGCVVAFYAYSAAKRRACGDCDYLVPAVRYLGWYGAVHTFEFDNGDYADEFIRANGGKLCGYEESRGGPADLAAFGRFSSVVFVAAAVGAMVHFANKKGESGPAAHSHQEPKRVAKAPGADGRPGKTEPVEVEPDPAGADDSRKSVGKNPPPMKKSEHPPEPGPKAKVQTPTEKAYAEKERRDREAAARAAQEKADKEDAERAAAAEKQRADKESLLRLTLIKKLIDDGKTADARYLLRGVIKELPGTAGAKEAAELLKKLPAMPTK